MVIHTSLVGKECSGAARARTHLQHELEARAESKGHLAQHEATEKEVDHHTHRQLQAGQGRGAVSHY